MPWKRTEKWRPCRPNTNSTSTGGGAVEHTETGELGYAKSVFPHREKLAADLAASAGVAVPPVCLDKVEGRTEFHAISALHGSESMDAALLESRLGARYQSGEVQDAFKRASGLMAFHSWLATEDLKNDHLVVSSNADGSHYEVAAIDFAFGLNFAADGGDIQVPSPPPALANNIDKDVIRKTVERIEATTDEQIQQIVNSIPDELLNGQAKDQLVKGLSARRGKIRKAMQDKGWLQ